MFFLSSSLRLNDQEKSRYRSTLFLLISFLDNLLEKMRILIALHFFQVLDCEEPQITPIWWSKLSNIVLNTSSKFLLRIICPFKLPNASQLYQGLHGLFKILEDLLNLSLRAYLLCMSLETFLDYLGNRPLIIRLPEIRCKLNI